ncbi:MobQ family relaxase [Salinisphaera hydrothermalis]|uniref:MobA-MobL family protein n=1 Tax=Salinisphaera hydrothermalis (strain C41B8) TaxID=1304275 RepID=A0A084INW7_SALHC|nr:MobQ family relaxase [Salinisphaera hydrothermalis]KEZ78401.1 MobA-MobL family protein [Salinisphaera hydrothermalis C41B8]
MAIYSCSVSTIKRSDGHSATAAIAYRARAKITDERTSEVFNYSNKKDLVHTEIVLPENESFSNQSDLWNEVEKKETRKNSVVAREFLIALPRELTPSQNIELARKISNDFVEKFGFASQFSIHNDKDNNNPHIHLLASTRKLEGGKFTSKTRELDTIKETSAIDWVRKNVANNTNSALQKYGLDERVDHRSLEKQQAEAEAKGDYFKALELSREPTRHIGRHPIFSKENIAFNKQVKANQKRREERVVNRIELDITKQLRKTSAKKEDRKETVNKKKQQTKTKPFYEQSWFLRFRKTFDYRYKRKLEADKKQKEKEEKQRLLDKKREEHRQHSINKNRAEINIKNAHRAKQDSISRARKRNSPIPRNGQKSTRKLNMNG